MAGSAFAAIRPVLRFVGFLSGGFIAVTLVAQTGFRTAVHFAEKQRVATLPVPFFFLSVQAAELSLSRTSVFGVTTFSYCSCYALQHALCSCRAVQLSGTCLTSQIVKLVPK